MKQLTLATVGFERYAKTTRRAAFLTEMERVVPWSALCALIEPFYPKPGNGRPPIGVEWMLRLYFLQHWFNLSDPAVEEALYDSAAMRRFVGIDLGREPVPDETTVCRFRHLLEAHDLGRPLFDQVQRHVAAKGLKVATGAIPAFARTDATIINAPSSTKNTDKARDPEMHQTKKGNQWYFGMKAHFGVDSRTKLIHAVAATPANVADSTVLPELLHERETRVWGDQAYRGQRAVIRQSAPKARDFNQSPLPPPRCCRRGRADEKPHQVESAGQGRTCHRSHQAGVRLCQAALSRAQKEHPSPARHLCAGQSVHRAPAPTALPDGVMCPQSGGKPSRTSQCGINLPQLPRLASRQRTTMPRFELPTACSDVP
jgi:IS5 family transposase